MTVTRFLGDVSRSSYPHLCRQASPPLSRAVRRAGLAAAAWLACLGAGVARGDDDLASQAFAVLEKYCYTCHGQNGSDSGGMNVLDRAGLVEGNRRVKPGDPDASLLIRRIERGDMPPSNRGKPLPRPDDSELTLLRDWITAGAPAPPATKTARTLQTTHDVLAAIAKHLQGLAPEDRPFQRYFTLTNLHNLRTRAALSKLVNSLSWERAIFVPESVDAQQAVLAIDLRYLGWGGELWQKVLDLYPYGLKHNRFPDDKTTQELARDVVEQTGTDVPFVRADWFIATASRPPLYNTLLGIPETAAELERQLGVDVETNFLNDWLVRAGFTNSGVSKQNRLIERHASRYGAYWRSYDFKARGERADLFRFPLGPVFERNPFGEFAFVHAGGEIIFHLPNGLQGYMLVNGQGRRIDEGPTDVVSDQEETSGTPAIVTGLSCMVCHAHGLNSGFEDTVREGTAVTGEALNKVRRLHRHPEPDALKKFLLCDDNPMFLSALEKAIGPILKELKPEEVAAELGLKSCKDNPMFLSALKKAIGPILRELEPIGPIAGGYPRKELKPEEVAAELGLNSEQLKGAIRFNRRLQEFGLRPLANGDSIKRENWEKVIDSKGSLFQLTAQELALGDPVNRESSDASEPTRSGKAAGTLRVGDQARIVSPGVDSVGLPISCDSTSSLNNFFNVGETVTVIEKRPHGDRFCIRAKNGNRGCALRTQLEPLGRANE